MVITILSHRFWLSLLLLVGLLTQINIGHATLTTFVNRTTVSQNEVIELSIRSNKAPIERIDFNELEKNFSIVSQRRSNQIAIIDGKKHGSYNLILALLPKSHGTLVIPVFKSQGELSRTISIEVLQNSVDLKQQRKDAFFENELNKQKVYVQEQLLYTMRFFHSVRFSAAEITPLRIKNASISFIGDQKKYNAVIDGVRYTVVEKQYAIFPEKSGELVLPEFIFTGHIASNFSNHSNLSSLNSTLNLNGLIQVRSDNYTINVLPKPKNYPSDKVWLPTPALKIDDNWHHNAPTLKVGESVTRTLTVTAENLDASQLPDLKLPDTTTINLYPDQAKSENRFSSTGLIGKRVFDTLMVPTKAGEFHIPSVSITWWNTTKNKVEQSVVAAKTITVMPTTQTVQPSLSLNEPETAVRVELPTNNLDGDEAVLKEGINVFSVHGIWPLLSLVFIMLWLITLYMWWSTRYRKPISSIEKVSVYSNKEQAAALKDLKKYCLSNDTKMAYQMLIHWCQLSNPEQVIRNLSHVRCHYENPELTDELTLLENALYGDSSSINGWNGKELVALLQQQHKRYKKKYEKTEKNTLKPLYPMT